MDDIKRREDLLRKIRGLLAKANGVGATEEESALFAAKAQELLAKYNIDEADVAEKKATTTHQRAKKSQWSMWRRVLLNQTCLFYTVKLISMEDDTIIYVGLDCNIEVAKSMFQYLVKAIDRLSAEYVSVSLNVPPDMRPGRVREDFRRGCSNRVCERLREMRLAQQKAPQEWRGSNPGNLPALMSQQSAEIKSYITHTLNLSLGSRPTKMKTGEAAKHGYRRGDEISLNTQVRGQGGRLMIGKR